MRAYRILACLLGVSIGAGHAAAGPIWFTYRVDGYTTQNAAGSVSFTTVNSGPLSLGAQANSSLVLATVRLGGLPPPVPSATAGATTDAVGLSRFALKVQITDAASDQVGVVRLTGWAENGWTGNGGIGALSNGTTIGFDSSVADVTVGTNRYEIVAAGASGLPQENVFGSVSVRMGSAVHTPEPGTLALAGIGVAALAGFSIRRTGY